MLACGRMTVDSTASPGQTHSLLDGVSGSRAAGSVTKINVEVGVLAQLVAKLSK